jgi:Flp pilus assembly protein TadB
MSTSPPEPGPAASGRTTSDAHAPAAPARGGLAGVLALYVLARLGLLALVAGVLVVAGTPLVIAVLVALVVALPLSMLLFRGLRARLDAALAVTRERRAAQRDALRAGLRGDPGGSVDDVPSGDRAERQPDGGAG